MLSDSGKVGHLMVVLFVVSALGIRPAGASQVLKGHVPLATGKALELGTMPGSTRLNLAIGLPLRDSVGLTKFLEDIYDPASPNYHKYLTPKQFTERFGPTEQDYQAVVDFFNAQGFTITGLHPNRVLIDVNGSVAQIEKAFHMRMRSYQHPTEARSFYAPDAEPVLDTSLPILHVSGLDNFVIPRPASLHIQPQSQDGNPKPNAGSGPGGSYMGRDFRAAYVPNVALNGAGQYVGLLEFDGYFSSDIAAYEALAGLTNVPLLNVLLDTKDGSAGAQNVEVALDIEMAISMAPGLAGVIVYEGDIGNSILNHMANDSPRANQLSASWTFPTDSTSDQIYQQFAAQGQSYFNASGDAGAYSGAVSSPADNPYITSVGGTTLTMSGQGQGWVSETTWNWASTGQGNQATGGGISTTRTLPGWQQGIDMTVNRGSTTRRNLPDVAMVADNVIAIADNGAQQFLGGTSIGAPLWAGFMALVNQQAVFAHEPTAGFINPAVYALGQGTKYASTFHDISTGNNTNSTSPTLFYACPGYDLCTGWGSPTGKGLINALAAPINARVPIAAGATVALETCSPTNGAVDPGEVVTVNLALQNMGGVNTVNLVGTLLSTNGITPLSGAQSYGVLASVGNAVGRQFTFVANGVCGNFVNPVLQLQDGATDLGIVSFDMRLGAPQTVFAENFDAAASPALPDSWTAVAPDGTTNWVTSTANADTGPNSAFAFEPTNAGVCELISPPLTISSTSAQLTFRHSFDTEVDPSNSALAYDGGVLEIKIDGSPFNDITVAGGSFVTGGYTRTIQTADNPLDTRQAWAGNSSGYITTTVNLPAAAASQKVQFKWRFGTDIGNFFGGTGWYVDSITLKDGFGCCAPATNADLALTQTVSPKTGLTGQTLAYTMSVSSLGPAPATSVTVTDSIPDNATFIFASPGYVRSGNTFAWNLGFMSAGRSTNLTVLIVPTAEGQVTNYASVSAASADANLDNNALTTVTPVYAPPAITLQPTNQTVAPGADVTFTVEASGTAPLSYQWRFNGTNMPGQTGTALQLTNVQPQAAGTYTVLVTNVAGSLTSGPAILRVFVAPTLLVSSSVVGGTNFALSLSSVSGQNYTLEYKNELTDATWTPVSATAVGTGAVLVLQDTNTPLGPHRFYRVRSN